MDGQARFAAGAVLHGASQGSGPPVIEIPISNRCTPVSPSASTPAARQHACRSPAAAGSVGGLGSDRDVLAIDSLLCKARAAG